MNRNKAPVNSSLSSVRRKNRHMKKKPYIQEIELQKLDSLSLPKDLLPKNITDRTLVSFKGFYKELTQATQKELVLHQLSVDLPRLRVLFFYDNVMEKKVLRQVNTLEEFSQNLDTLHEIYKAKMYFLSYFCTQAVFCTPFIVLSDRYVLIEKDIYVLDSEDSYKCVKLTFSKNCIFFLVLGQFEQVDLTSPEGERHVLAKIDFSLSCVIEVYKEKLVWPQELLLQWARVSKD